MTQEKKIFESLLPGIAPATFQSRAQHSTTELSSHLGCVFNFKSLYLNGRLQATMLECSLLSVVYCLMGLLSFWVVPLSWSSACIISELELLCVFRLFFQIVIVHFVHVYLFLCCVCVCGNDIKCFMFFCIHFKILWKDDMFFRDLVWYVPEHVPML